MNQLLMHNQSLRDAIENAEVSLLKEAVNLDSIDLVLRQCLSVEEMREAGSFFTGQILASKLVKSFNYAITNTSVILDPTCGAGNLLIECSRMLGVEKTLSKTLLKWGKCLWGFDIHASFIEATKLRLIIEALNRGVEKDCTIEKAFGFLHNIKVIDTLSVGKDHLQAVTHVVLNPPFVSWPSPGKYYWRKGKVNAAGIVFDHYLRMLPENCCISAVLPDVLRSGTRYNYFREFCSLKLVALCEPYGRFNAKTDVDVFILHGTIVDQESFSTIKWQQDEYSGDKISDYFDVCIGPLVAYRDPELGSEYPYFYSKNTPSWAIIKEVKETRKFNGKLISPPCILVKRTSSPGDKDRAAGTIIKMNSMIAVENHLIVIKPKSGLMSDCKKLLKILRSDETNEFLNKRIRLRHLTVQVIKDIPLKSAS